MKTKCLLITLGIGMNSVVFSHMIYGVNHIVENQRATDFPTYVQMGNFVKKSNATALMRDIQFKKFQNVTIQSTHKHYKVIVGPFKNTQELMVLYRAFHVTHIQSNYTTNTLTKYSKSRSSEKHASKLVTTPHKLSNKKQQIEMKKTESTNILLKAKSWGIPINGMTSKGWYINSQVGGQFSSISSSTTVNNSSGFSYPNNQDIYSARSHDGSVLLGIGIGKRYELTYPWMSALSIGLQYQYFFANNLSGEITEFSLPEFNNYTYQWPLASNLILANAKFNFRDYQKFSPYFAVGLGCVIQQGQGYKENAAADVTPRISPSYKDNSNTQLAYTLGVGLDYPLGKQTIFSLGYQFSDLGSIKSGYGQNSWSTQRLNFGNNYSNAFVFSATYLFDKKATSLKN